MNFVVVERKTVEVPIPVVQDESELKLMPEWWFRQRRMETALMDAEDELEESDRYADRLETTYTIAMGFVAIAAIVITLILNGGGF